MLVLSANAVLEALECVHSGVPLPDSNPITQFLLVRQQLMQPEYLSGKHAELKVVRDILEGLLLHVLGDVENVDALYFIRDVFQTYHTQLQAYTLLYYWYMRPDLGLTIQEISQAGNLVERSLRRRRENALNLLAQDLIDKEVEIRQRHRTEVLRARLPFPENRSLYGREWLIERIIHGLSNGAVLITGVPGVGKTSLASAAAHAMLPELNDLFWVNLIAGIDAASQIAEKMEADVKSAEAYFANHPVLLILENLAEPVPFNQAKVIATSVEPIPGWVGVIIHVPPLDKYAAKNFFLTIQGAAENDLFENIFNLAEGVPGIMAEYLHWMHVLPVEEIPDHLSIHNYFYEVWDRLPLSSKWVWVGAFLLYPQSLGFDQLKQVFCAADEQIFDLVQHHVLTVDDVYCISPSARQFLEKQAVHLAYDDLVIQSLNRDVRLWLLMLANGFNSYVSSSVLEMLIRQISPTIPKLGLWGHWQAIITQLKPSLNAVVVEYEEARLLRWRGQFENALALLNNLIQKTEEQDNLHGYALLELGLVLVYRDDYGAALNAVQKAAKIFQQLQNKDGLIEVQKLQARILLYSDPQEALNILAHLPEKDASAMVSACEAALFVQETDFALDFAWQALQLSEHDSPHYGRALSTLATVLHAQKEHKTALDYQQQAVNVLDMTIDMVGLARARNNLGVLYYDLKKPILAKSNWRIALDLFAAIQDTVGLKTVQANLDQILAES